MNHAQCRQQAKDAFESFLADLPAVPPRYRTARELAGYILWSAIVNPQGHYRRPAMLMSKNRMSSIWGWDHCFNAMALAKGHPALAWDQMQVLFDFQDEHGALPDCVSTERIIWTCCKPPVHGWALRRMLEANPKVAGRRLYGRMQLRSPHARSDDRWLLFHPRDGQQEGRRRDYTLGYPSAECPRNAEPAV